MDTGGRRDTAEPNLKTGQGRKTKNKKQSATKIKQKITKGEQKQVVKDTGEARLCKAFKNIL